MFERYVTEKIAPQQRIRRWCEFGSSTLSSIVVHPYAPENFRARIIRAPVGSLGISRVETTPAHAIGSGVQAGCWSADNPASVLMSLQQSGSCRIIQSGRELTLKPGDIALWDLNRRWEVDDCQNNVHMLIKIPTERLRQCVGDVEPCLMSPLRSGENRTLLLASIVENIGRLVFSASDAVQPKAVADVLFGALQIAFDGRTGLPADQASDDQSHEVFEFVDARVVDPAVTVASLAADLGMSIRSFQRFFYQRGMSARSYIVSRRIEMAAESLRAQPSGARARITDIALATGFNDPGYFSRVFQQRYGVTPGEYVKRLAATN